MSVSVNVLIQKEEDWYVAKCLENSVASQGKTVNEAIANLREALELYFEDNADFTPSSETYLTTMEVAI